MPLRPNRHRNSLNRHLFRAQTHSTSLSSLTALLLTQASWKTLSSLPETTPTSRTPTSCTPLIFCDSDQYTLHLVHHPSGASLSTLYNIGHPSYVDYRASDGAVAVSLSWQEQPAILYAPLHSRPTRLWASGGLSGARVRGVALGRGVELAACVGRDVVRYSARPGDAFLHERARLPDPDRAQVAVARFADAHTVVTGTANGHVRRWDLRAGRAPVWSVDPSGARLYISDVRVGETSGDLYISCDLATSNSLARWDMRMGDGPKAEFEKTRWGEGDVFDVSERAGVVVAGGSGQKVSVWDCRRGGGELRSVRLDESIKLIRLMGLGEGVERPGMFVKGEFEVFVFEVGGS